MPIPTPVPKASPTPPRKPRTLPLPRPALTALDAARTCPTTHLSTHLDRLVPHLTDGEALQYLLKRLHNGLTTPVARRNYTILLCAITRRTKATNALLTTPYPQYTTPREEALARIALIAALVRAGVKDPSIITLLRDIACAESGRWRLGDACVALVKSLIGIADHSILREWCRQRRFFGDGLHLACVLLQHDVLSEKAFEKIYHSATDVRKALLEASDTGFSMLGKQGVNIPPVWMVVLSMNHELLGLSAWPVLQIPSAGVEKKLLLISLLPVVARYVSIDSFDHVFTPFVGKISRTLCDMREHSGIRIRLERVTESAKRAVKNVFDTIGSQIWEQLSKVTREVDEADQLCSRFILWAVRHGIVHRLFPKLDILSNMEERLSKKLFEATVREFAKTPEPGIRSSLVRFLFAFAAKCGFVDDAVKIMALYTGFEGGDGAKFTLQRFTSGDGDTFGGCLPVPIPSLSQVDAGAAFRRLVEFSADQRVTSRCLQVLRKGLESGMKPRCAQRIQADKNVEKAIFRILHSYSLPAQGADKPLIDSLRIVAEFVAIQYLAPVEDPEAGLKTAPEFQSWIESLEEAVSAVSRADEHDEDEEEPLPVERVAHLITDLCGHESASFRQISVKAVEALGPRLDDSVTAVLFDALESYVSGSGVADTDDMEGGEEEDADDGEDDDGDDEEETEGVAGKKSDDDMDIEENGSDPNENHDEESSEDGSEAEIGDASKDKGDGGENRSEEDDDSGPDVDMDPDDEDPEVLAQFDRRLAMHIKLMNKEKKSAKQRKLKTQFRFTQVTRVLSLIESVAKILRMRLETAKEIDQRTPIVFLDLHARLYEFALSNVADNGRFLTQVTSIASKQMMLPSSFFSGKITDSETVVEIAKRFLQSIRNCGIERKPSDEETRIISKSAGCLVGTAAALTNDDYGQFLPIYDELVRQALQSTKHLVNPGMLNSFFRKTPSEASKLFTIIEELLEGDDMTRNIRTTASEIILELAEAARQSMESDDKKLHSFWVKLQNFLTISVNAKNVKKWRPLAISNFVQAASHGLKADRFKDGESLSACLSEMVKTATLSRQDHLKLLKLLRSSGDRTSVKRKLSAHDEEAQDEEAQEREGEQVEVTKPKRRKRSKRVK